MRWIERLRTPEVADPVRRAPTLGRAPQEPNTGPTIDFVNDIATKNREVASDDHLEFNESCRTF
jgi:hypothetical protein